MHVSRTQLAGDIIAEFLPPIDPQTNELASDAAREVILYCLGMPSVPEQEELIQEYAKMGYWVFFPRYRGSWESGGKFLGDSPARDILDCIESIKDGVRDIWSEESYQLDPSRVHLIGSSFGGAVALVVAGDSAVDTALALSPVVDWRAESPGEPFDHLRRFTEEGFKNGYRIAENGWDRLQAGELCNPVDEIDKIKDADIHIIYSHNDTIVPPEQVEAFAHKANISTTEFEEKGHLGGSSCIDPDIQPVIKKHINT